VSEALAIEEVYGRKYVQWQDDLAAGSAKAMCVLAWIIWRRDGRDVAFADILGGKADFDLAEMLRSVWQAAEAEAEAGPGPDGAPGTGAGTTRPEGG
jgi:hypothetical protein